MEIKIIKDGLKNKDGGPLHTYEYNLKDKEIIDVYHLRPGETIVWHLPYIGWVKKKQKNGYFQVGIKRRPYINGTYKYKLQIMKFAFQYWKLHSV